MLEVTSLAKSYGGQPVFSDITFMVDAGQIVSLLGPNGAGKTTLLSIIAGLRRPDSGSVRICGADVSTSRSDALQHLGIAPQETSIQLSLTGRENVTFFAELQGVSRRDLKPRLNWVIEALGLGEFVDKPTQQLSGGERRRIHTAIAIVGRPPVVLLDEPTVGADIESRGQLLEAVRHLAMDGAAVLYTTHYLPEVSELGGRVLMLDRGRLIADGTVPELLAAHSGDVVELTFNGPVTRFANQAVVAHGGHQQQGPSHLTATVDGYLTHAGAANPTPSRPHGSNGVYGRDGTYGRRTNGSQTTNGVSRHRIDRGSSTGIGGGIGNLEVRGNVVRAWGDAITAVTAELLSTLGPDDPQLLDINLVGGSLESVYLSLTGRHYDADDPGLAPAEPPADPADPFDAVPERVLTNEPVGR